MGNGPVRAPFFTLAGGTFGVVTTEVGDGVVARDLGGELNPGIT